MSDADMAYRLRMWRKAIAQGRVFDATDWLAQCYSLFGARSALKSLRHPDLLGRAAQLLWGETKALIAQRAA